MVVHLCCSVDAGYFLKRLKEELPEEKLIGYFFDPNIHPYAEFKLRSLDTRRVCEKLGVEFVEGPYLLEEWYTRTAGLEREPEKGSRCSQCFDFSLEESARFAKKIGEKRVTTSLLMSPMKSREQLKQVGEYLKEKYQIDFFAPDYRKKGGTQAQQLFAKELEVYRQDYCGCIYGLWNQKKELAIVDLSSPVGGETLPGSVEERLELYRWRLELEEAGVPYKIRKEEFLNYRLLRGGVKRRKPGEKSWKGIPTFILFYSHLPRPIRGEIVGGRGGVGEFNRKGILFLDLEEFNRLTSLNYSTIWELYQTPPHWKTQLRLREKLFSSPYSLSPVVVVEKIETGYRYQIEIESKLFPDTREELVIIPQNSKGADNGRGYFENREVSV
ncbi:MAG: diacylglucosamine hydrolase like protein [Epsilonproteobacteria bacterium]|nr:diacylglucosamine hydrolase like protein [Campylobacterota bacterium]NPA89173.1 epoxyqueuosine reductase QueH [Campylobacterota bacterium]